MQTIFALFCCLFFYHAAAFAQKTPSERASPERMSPQKTSPQRWVMNTPHYAKSNQSHVIIDRIELTSNQTIVRLGGNHRPHRI
ncbi:MAG: hypothetical protein RI894_410 [Bacteroidota bacterium]